MTAQMTDDQLAFTTVELDEYTDLLNYALQHFAQSDFAIQHQYAAVTTWESAFWQFYTEDCQRSIIRKWLQRQSQGQLPLPLLTHPRPSRFIRHDHSADDMANCNCGKTAEALWLVNIDAFRLFMQYAIDEFIAYYKPRTRAHPFTILSLDVEFEFFFYESEFGRLCYEFFNTLPACSTYDELAIFKKEA